MEKLTSRDGSTRPYPTPTFLRDLDNSTVMTTALEDSTLEG